MVVNLDDLGNSIAERRREALKPIMAELLECFAYERVPVSEFLDVLAATLHETRHARGREWGWCVGYLEQAATHAMEAEKVEKLDALIAPTLDDADRLWRGSPVKERSVVVKVIVEGKTPLKLLSEDGEVTLSADEEG